VYQDVQLHRAALGLTTVFVYMLFVPAVLIDASVVSHMFYASSDETSAFTTSPHRCVRSPFTSPGRMLNWISAAVFCYTAVSTSSAVFIHGTDASHSEQLLCLFSFVSVYTSYYSTNLSHNLIH
jgi:Na+/pantothenate symporter